MKPVQPAERSYAAASLAPSWSARSADVEGNIMSGVTVATIRRSMSVPSLPACSSACRAAGSERSDSACVLGRDPALADAGALHDPLVRRVDQLRELVVRDHALGRVGAERR